MTGSGLSPHGKELQWLKTEVGNHWPADHIRPPVSLIQPHGPKLI